MMLFPEFVTFIFFLKHFNSICSTVSIFFILYVLRTLNVMSWKFAKDFIVEMELERNFVNVKGSGQGN